MKNTITIFVGVALLAYALSAGAEYRVGLTHGTNKHRPEFSFAAEDSYLLHSARNEWEPFQVLIRDDSGATNVNVSATEFTGPGDPIETVELYRVHYVPVLPDEISHFPPDPSKAGDWPDGLVPFVDHFFGESRSGAPFDVPALYTQAVFVDVYVPEDQAPGDYEATVTATADGQADWTGAVTLHVWDFELPNSVSIDTNYNFSPATARNWHAGHGGVHDEDTLMDLYFKEFARHRMGLYTWKKGGPVATWNYGAGSFDMDWTDFDAYHEPYLDGTFYRPGYEFTGIRLPGAPGERPGDVAAEDWEREYWDGWAEHFKAKGWIEKLWYYMPDEPSPDEYASLADLAARLHNADPDLQPMVTEQYTEALGPDVDIWCPDEPLFSDSLPWGPYPEVYDELRAQDMKTWWYNCVSANFGLDYMTHMVDHESTHMRAWLWLTRRYHFQGILFWGTNYLTGRGQDIWDSQYSSKFLCQGDGTMIYPGTIDRIGGVTDIPVASLRMKYLREGMEDYEYFHLLDEGGNEQWVDDVTRTVAPLTYQWEHDWEAVLDWRRKVGEKITGDLDEDAPAAPTNLSAEPMVEAVALTWTSPADEDLAGFDIWYGLYEGDEYFGGRVGAGVNAATLQGLAPGREHSIWIKSFDENGNRSEASDIIASIPLSGDDDDRDDDREDHVRNAVSLATPDDTAIPDNEEYGPSGCGGS
jgi:Glycoside hydrolase 123, catalytic domain